MFAIWGSSIMNPVGSSYFSGVRSFLLMTHSRRSSRHSFRIWYGFLNSEKLLAVGFHSIPAHVSRTRNSLLHHHDESKSEIEIVRMYIERSNFKEAFTRLFGIYMENNNAGLISITAEHLRKLLRGMASEILKFPNRYSWFMSIYNWKIINLFLEDYMIFSEFYIRINATRDLEELLHKMFKHGGPIREDTTFKLFNVACVRNHIPSMEIVIRKVYDVNSNYISSIAAQEKISLNRIFFVRFSKHLRNLSQRSNAPCFMKHAIFFCEYIDNSDRDSVDGVTQLLFWVITTQYPKYCSGDMKIEPTLVSDCQRQLFRFNFIPHNDLRGDFSLSTIISEYVDNFSKTPRTSPLEKRAVASLLSAFLYGCRRNDKDLVNNVFRLLDQESNLIIKYAEFILSCLLESSFSVEDKSDMAIKIIGAIDSSTVTDITLKISANLAVSTNSTKLLKMLHSLSKSVTDISEDTLCCLQSAAVRMKQYELFKKSPNECITTRIYAYIDNHMEKLDTATSILRIASGKEFRAHINEIMSWPRIYENFRYIYISLVRSGAYDQAIRLFGIVNARFPALVGELGAQMILNVITKTTISLDEVFDTLTHFMEDDRGDCRPVIIAVGQVIKTISGQSFDSSKLEKAKKLVEYAVANNPSDFPGFLAPLIKNIVTSGFDKGALEIFLLVVNSRFMKDKIHFEQITESYRFLAETSLHELNWDSLKTLLECASQYTELLEVKLKPGDLHLPYSIYHHLHNSTSLSSSSIKTISPKYAALTKKCLVFFYDILISKPSLKRFILTPLKGLLNLSKFDVSFVKDSLLGKEFDRSLYEFLISLKNNNIKTYSIEARNCIDILLKECNRDIILKTPTCIDAQALKELIGYLVHRYSNENEIITLVSLFTPEIIASIGLKGMEMEILIDILLKRARYPTAFILIQNCLSRHKNNSSSLTLSIITTFIDSCVTNNRLYLASKLLKIRTLPLHVDINSIQYLEIFLKYCAAMHKFDNVREIMCTLREKLHSKLHKCTKPAPYSAQDNLCMADHNSNVSRNTQHETQDALALECKRDLSSPTAASSTISQSSECVISTSTLIFVLRLILLCDRLDIIEPFMLYIYNARNYISESAFNEIVRVFVQSKNFVPAQLTLQIMSRLNITIPEPAFIKVFDSLVDHNNLVPAWRMFNFCCVIVREKSIADITSKKLLMKLYSAAKLKKSPSCQEICRNIEALNNKIPYMVNTDIEATIDKCFYKYNFTKKEHEKNTPLSYPVKSPSYTPVIPNIPLSNEKFKLSTITAEVFNGDDIDCAYSQLSIALRRLKELNYHSSLVSIVALLSEFYSIGVSNERLGALMLMVFEKNGINEMKTIANGARFLRGKKRAWFLSSLISTLRSNPRLSFIQIIATYCSNTNTDMPLELVNYLIFMLPRHGTLKNGMKILLKKKLVVSEALLYRLYIMRKGSYWYVPIEAKFFRRLVMILINSEKPLTYKSLEFVLYICNELADPENAMLYWERLVGKQGVSPTLKCYDLLMEVLTNNGKTEEASRILLNLIKNNQITEELYNKTHVNVLANAGLHKQALDVIMIICVHWRKVGKYSPLPIDVPMMISVAYGIAKTRNFLDMTYIKAITYIFRMTMDLAGPFWSSLIHELIDNNDFDTMDLIFSAVGEKALSIWSFEVMIRIFIEYTKKGVLKKAELIYVDLKRKLIHRCVPTEAVEDAIRILCDIDVCNETIYHIRRLFNILSKDIGVLPPKQLIEAIVDKHLEINSLPYAEYYLAVMDEMGMGVNLDMCSRVIFGWVDVEMYHRALVLINTLISKGIEFDSKLIFATSWVYLNLRDRTNVHMILDEISTKGYMFNREKLLEYLIIEAYRKSSSEDGFKVWCSHVKVTDNTPISLGVLINAELDIVRLVEPTGYSYPSIKSTGLHLNPRITTNKYLWALKGSDTTMDTGILPPHFVSGENREPFLKGFYQSPLRRPRVNRIS